MRKSDGYDPMAPAPRATPTGQGSGLNPPAGPHPTEAPLRTDGTSAARFNSIADAFANLHRPLPGSTEHGDGDDHE